MACSLCLLSLRCSALVLATASTAAAQVTEEHLQELIRRQRPRVGRRRRPAAHDAANGPALPGQADRPVVSLTLDDAIKLALDRNLDIAVQRLNPQTFDFSLASLQAIYKPTLTSTLSQQSQTTPVDADDLRAAARHGHRHGHDNFNGGVAQNFPWGGGTFTVTLNNNRQTTTSLTALFNPNFNTNWSALVHAAAAAQLQDRQHPPAAGRHQAESGHLRDPAAGADHQHASRTSGMPTGTTSSRCSRSMSRSARWSSPNSS